ncbi:hypothetical protein QYE76_045174 [Lolium multiflorum]|uniref:Uncharacterized protein n=1 Tax=Lolium multiflorum TaxID=4521 RepID=A0AAD8TMH9_LOLMU|nr:hypothetical protein QYE76_045174 [Lolium multiflorum]
MGKKKSASTSDAAKVSRDWSASAISSRDINKLRSLGFISASEEDIRLPGGIGFVVRQDVDYLDYPMKESVQGWRNKWFYLRDHAVSGQRSNIPPFENKLVAKPKKSWQNALSPEERVIADKLFDQVVALKNTGGLTMCGTEVVSVFLQRRVQPLMSRPHQLWLYTVAHADCLFFMYSSDDYDEVPLPKRAKLTLGRKASVQEPKPSPAKSTPPSRTTVEKIPVSRVIPAGSAPASSAARDHPIYATVDAVTCNHAKKENALLKEEVSNLKQQMKDEQDARRAAAVAIDKKEGVLRESIKDLLEAANITVTRRHQLREDSTSDALSLAAESNVQVLGLLQKTRGALSRLYSMIFPKVKQDKTLGEMADAFLVDPSEPVEVLKRRSRLFGAVLTFQLLMGHGLESDLEKLSKALPVDDNNHLVDLEPFKRSEMTCANQLLELVDGAQAKLTPEAAPGPSSAPP